MNIIREYDNFFLPVENLETAKILSEQTWSRYQIRFFGPGYGCFQRG